MVFSEDMDAYEALSRSIVLAERAHRGQVRKGTADPYIHHPLAVAMLVLSHGFGLPCATVGVLHDVLEDTQVRRDEIERRFGREIATAVADLTEDAGIHPWEERKLAYVRHLAHATDLALPVCAADKIHNLSSTLWEGRDPREVEERFRHPLVKISAYHRAVEQALGARGMTGPLMVELRRVVGEFARFAGADPDDDRLV